MTEKIKTIYKYELGLVDKQELKLPCNAQILSLQFQCGKLCLWALVAPQEERMLPYTFFIYGTGHLVTAGHHDNYLGTVQHDSGMLIWHVFYNGPHDDSVVAERENKNAD